MSDIAAIAAGAEVVTKTVERATRLVAVGGKNALVAAMAEG
jgi:hypothetical protein